MTRHREIESLDELDTLLADGGSLRGVRLESLDLTSRVDALVARPDVRGLVILGGVVPARLADHLVRHGAMIFPAAHGAPVDIFRSRLYSPEELYAGLSEHGYHATPDARAYGWSRDEASVRDVYATLLRAIHDDQVGDALDEALSGRCVVGVMGGHTHARGSDAYADAARLGRRLAERGVTVITGGGPGAMEATNLGAFVPSDAALADALATLATVPSFVPDVGAWAEVALAVRAAARDATPEGAGIRSIGVPTWFYGHEPPNVFCDGIAKYFSNALREDGLLARSTEGVVVLPGTAGTVQEIFQAVTPLYYAGAGTTVLPRLVLVGRRHWTTDIPLWPAVEALAAGRSMATAVTLVDSVEDAVDVVLATSA